MESFSGAQRIIITAVLASVALFVACGAGSRQSTNENILPPSRATVYYVDCSSNASGSGTSQELPWNALASANAFTFQPGDQLLLKRGTICSGNLSPHGSGKAGAPIIIDAYGTGPRPIIDAGTSEEAIRLLNQQYWKIGNLEIVGGDMFGIYISGDSEPVLNHIYFRNLDLHGAHDTSVTPGESGELVIHADGTTLLSDIRLDGILAHDSRAFEGIDVVGGSVTLLNGSTAFGKNVVVQNSAVHNVYGTGILLIQVEDSWIQGNVVHDTGVYPDCPDATVGIACVICRSTVIQNNQFYANQTLATTDGGAFDLENAVNSVVQYNYGHDSAGYCIGHFAGGGDTCVNNSIRYNICSNNGQKAPLSYQDEIAVGVAVGGGSFNGVQIYNNTFYWNPAGEGPAIYTPNTVYSGTNSNFFKNNIIYSAVPSMVNVAAGLTPDNNIYWTISGGVPIWKVNDSTYTGFVAYQAGAGLDNHSFYTDPMMNDPTYHAVGKPEIAFTLLPSSPAISNGANVCSGIPGCSMGDQDFWGNALPNGMGYSIGAHQPR